MRAVMLALATASCAVAAAPPTSVEDPLPRFALRRLGTTRLRGEGLGHSLSPDGRFVAVGGLGAVRVFDLPGGVTAREIRVAPDQFVTPLDYCADGRQLVVEVSRWTQFREETAFGLELIDLGKGSCHPLLKVQPGYRVFTAVAGERLIVVSNSQRMVPRPDRAVLRCWDLRTRAKLAEFEMKDEDVFAFSPDGTVMAKGHQDGTVTLHAFPELRLIRPIKAHVQPVVQLVFSPDGTRLASFIQSTVDPSIFDTAEKAIDATGPARVWDVRTGKRLANLFGHAGQLGPLTFSPDGHYLAASDSVQATVVWDLRTGKVAARFRDAGGTFAISPDGKQFALSRNPNGVLFADLPSGRTSAMRPEAAGLHALGYTPDGRHLLCGGSTLAVLDTKTGGSPHPPSHRNGISRVEFAGRGETVVTTDLASETRVWRTEDGKHMTSLAAGGPDEAVYVNPTSDGRSLVCVTRSGELQIRKLPGGELVVRRSLGPLAAGTYVEQVLRLVPYSAHGTVVLCPDTRRGGFVARDNCLYSIDTVTTRRLGHLSPGGAIQAASPDGRYLAATDQSLRELQIFDGQTGRLVRRQRVGQERSFTHPIVSPDGGLMA